MQSFNVDISAPTTPMVLFAMQADSMSRFFAVTIVDNGAPWQAPEGAAWTVRFGAPGMPAGWYDTIEEPGGGSHAAIVIDGNTATVEIAEQAISTPGKNILCVLINDSQGCQLASWQFQLSVQPVPGLEAPEATVYYNALTAQVAQTLANSQSAAASAQQAQEYAESIDPQSFVKMSELLSLVYPVGSIYMSANNVSPQTFLGGTWQQIQGQFLLAASGSYPAGSTGGAAQQTLATENIAAHNHGPAAGERFLSVGGAANGALVSPGTGVMDVEWNANWATADTGSGEPFSIMPPYLAVYMWQRTA